jgi:uncharacterized protein (DUF58 family)
VITDSRHPLQERFDPQLIASLRGLSFKARYLTEGFLIGQHRSPFHGFSVEFSDYRRYQSGDDLRHLDWRLYARSDRLCVRRYMQETNLRFYVLCDTSASMQYRGVGAWGSKLECAKVVSAALTWLLLKQNDAAGMITLNGGAEAPEFIRPSQKPSQFGLMLKQFEALTPGGGPRLSSLLEHAGRLVHRRSVILFVSDLLDPSDEVLMGFRQLRFLGHDVVVMQVLDRDEIDFPFAEGSVFEDLETGERRAGSPGTLARAAYLERFKAFMAEYERLFQELDIPHCVITTDANPSSALAHFLAHRRRLF